MLSRIGDVGPHHRGVAAVRPWRGPREPGVTDRECVVVRWIQYDRD